MPPVLASLCLVCGLIVMLMGWRLGLVIAVLDFSVFGALVGAWLVNEPVYRWLSAALGAVAFGALVLWLDKYGVVVMNSLIAAAVALLVMESLSLPTLAGVLAAFLALVCTVALCAIASVQTTAVMTAVQGGAMAGFSLIAMILTDSMGAWMGLRRLVENNPVVFALLLFTPVMIGVMFQLAAIQSEEVAGH